MIALNLKRRKEGMEVVNVLGAGNGKTQGVGERRKPGSKGHRREGFHLHAF